MPTELQAWVHTNVGLLLQGLPYHVSAIKVWLLKCEALWLPCQDSIPCFLAFANPAFQDWLKFCAARENVMDQCKVSRDSLSHQCIVAMRAVCSMLSLLRAVKTHQGTLAWGVILQSQSCCSHEAP
eukprot:3490356-Amphidinium_carterae.2